MRGSCRHAWLCILCVIGLWCAMPLAANASWREALPNAQLMGQGDLRIWGFRIYTARLWSAEQAFDRTQSFALELVYHRAISRADFVDASVDEIRRTSGSKVSDQQLQTWRAEMNKAFVDVAPGDRLVGVNLPGKGCQFYVGDQLHYAISDSAFAEAFFSIWFDPKTRDSALRKQLLGER